MKPRRRRSTRWDRALLEADRNILDAFAARDYDAAVREARALLRAFPRNARAKLLLAEMLELAGRDDEARKQLNRLLDESELAVAARIARIQIDALEGKRAAVRKELAVAVDDIMSLLTDLENALATVSARFRLRPSFRAALLESVVKRDELSSLRLIESALNPPRR